MHPQQRFLHHVLGLGDAAEHPVGDGERDRPQLLEQLLPRAHAANPRHQLGCAGRHPSSRLALEAPRISVISTAPASPVASRGAGTGCFPIAPVAPATNTLISSSLIRGIIYTHYDEMAAAAVTPASTAAREAVTPLHAAGPHRQPTAAVRTTNRARTPQRPGRLPQPTKPDARPYSCRARPSAGSPGTCRKRSCPHRLCRALLATRHPYGSLLGGVEVERGADQRQVGQRLGEVTAG